MFQVTILLLGTTVNTVQGHFSLDAFVQTAQRNLHLRGSWRNMQLLIKGSSATQKQIWLRILKYISEKSMVKAGLLTEGKSSSGPLNSTGTRQNVVLAKIESKVR